MYIDEIDGVKYVGYNVLMKNLENILIAYKNDIKFWNSDFGEGHIVLENRELLKPYEDDERVKALDDKALKLINDDKSKG